MEEKNNYPKWEHGKEWRQLSFVEWSLNLVLRQQVPATVVGQWINAMYPNPIPLTSEGEHAHY